MHRTRTTLATLLLLTPTASALDLEAPSNKLREVSSYLDKACTVVQTVGGYADGAQSAGQVISTIEGLLGSNTGIGGMIGNGSIEVKRVLVNGRFVCKLNELTNYAASVVDVNTWRDLGQDAIRNAVSGDVAESFGDMPAGELEKQADTLLTSLKTNVNAFRRNVNKISKGYMVAHTYGANPEDKSGIIVALATPDQALNLTTANLAGSEAIGNKLSLMMQRQEQAATNKAMDDSTVATADLSKELLGNGLPDTGTYNQLDDRAAKATSSRESWEALTNTLTTMGRADIVYGERFGQALTNIAKGQALSNYEMARKAEEEYDKELQDVEKTREAYNEVMGTTVTATEDMIKHIDTTQMAVGTAANPDPVALDALAE